MELLEAIRTRRSVKQFDPNHEITDEELRFLFEHAALSPSSFNMQNWRFVAVRDKALKEKLKEASWGQAQVADASVCIVISGDLKAHEDCSRYLRNAPPEVREALEPMIKGFYDGHPDRIMQEACRSVGIVSMAIMLLAREMDYHSCPMIGFDPRKVSEIVGLDEDHPPLMMVVIGKALAPARPRMGLLSLEELVSIDRFGNHPLRGEIPED